MELHFDKIPPSKLAALLSGLDELGIAVGPSVRDLLIGGNNGATSTHQDPIFRVFQSSFVKLNILIGET